MAEGVARDCEKRAGDGEKIFREWEDPPPQNKHRALARKKKRNIKTQIRQPILQHAKAQREKFVLQMRNQSGVDTKGRLAERADEARLPFSYSLCIHIPSHRIHVLKSHPIPSHPCPQIPSHPIPSTPSKPIPSTPSYHSTSQHIISYYLLHNLFLSPPPLPANIDDLV